VNDDFARRNQARDDRTAKFGPIGIDGRIDGIKHLDAKQRSFWQPVYAIAASGFEPGVEIKRQHGSSRDAHWRNFEGLTMSCSCKQADQTQTYQRDTFHGLGTSRISRMQGTRMLQLR
jgi:hypothetical protein